MALRDALHARAAALQRAGLAAARDGELHRSLSLLRQAATQAPLGERASRVLALAALCLGEAGIAARAWRRSGEGEPALLDAGSVRDALRLYNEALAEAHGGNGDAAASRVGQSLDRLPDLVPAHRLRALLAAERGDVSGARAACEAGLAVCRDDPVLRRCLASLPAAAAAPVPSPAPATAAVSPARPRVTARLGAAWAGSVLLAVALTRVLGDHTPGRVVLQPPPTSDRAPTSAPAANPAPSPAPPAAKTAAAAPFDFAAYRRGRDAFARGDWPGAVEALSAAAAAPAGAYYRDDALYLLARAQARAARPGDARATAARLLAEHPASIFANRITRHIARQGTE